MEENKNNQPEIIVKKESSSSKDAIYIIFILLLAGLAGFLGWKVSDLSGAVEDRDNELNARADIIAEMEEMLSLAGFDTTGVDVKENLQNMLLEYDELSNNYDEVYADNEEMRDSIAMQKAHIEQLLQDVDRYKGNARELYKLKKETETLRTIMKGYIHTIDSLNTANMELTDRLNETTHELTNVKTERDTYKDKTENLEEKVSAGSILTTASVLGNALRYKSSGSTTETERARRAEMFQICFKLMENRIAKAGSRVLYLRVITPDGKVLGKGEKVETDDGTILYSDKREVNYENKRMDLCVYYTMDGEELDKGEYVLEVYTDGYKIAKTTVPLK